MKEQMLKLLITALLTFFDEALMKQFADSILDFVEDKVRGTASTIDDRLILPICDKVRNTFGITNVP